MQLKRLFSLAFLIVLAACSGGGSGEAPINVPLISRSTGGPDEVVKQFLEDWKAANYPAMYAALSPQSQEFYPQPVFQTAYQDAVSAINFNDLTYSLKDTRIQGMAAAVTYDVTLTSPTFGAISD